MPTRDVAAFYTAGMICPRCGLVMLIKRPTRDQLHEGRVTVECVPCQHTVTLQLLPLYEAHA